MKRIQFIAPVESMRGNLSGKQNLLYNENDNKAFEAPDGKQYARNYQPTFIGARVARNGKKYFILKTKSACVMNATSRKRLAVLGSVAAIRSALMKEHAQDWAQIVAICVALQTKAIAEGQSTTWYKIFYDTTATALVQGRSYIIFSTGTTTVQVGNPYALGLQEALAISDKVWLKFAPYLASDSNALVGGAHAYVQGKKVFIVESISWSSMIGDYKGTNDNWDSNFLSDLDSDNSKVTYNDGTNERLLMLNGSDIATSTHPVADDHYTLGEIV